MRGKLMFESLKNGTLDLVDVALLNDALDCSDENDRRVAAELEAQKRNG